WLIPNQALCRCQSTAALPQVPSFWRRSRQRSASCRCPSNASMRSIRARLRIVPINRRTHFQDRALPILEDPRYERFSQLVSKGMPQGQAYTDAGFQASTNQSIRVGAHKLAKKPAIVRRIAELQEAAARRAERESGIDKKWVLLRLRDLSD